MKHSFNFYSPHWIFVLVYFCTTFFSCGKKGDPTPANNSSTTNNTLPCDSIWSSYSNSSLYHYGNGELEVAVKDIGFSMQQQPLHGDFEMTLSFKNLNFTDHEFLTFMSMHLQEANLSNFNSTVAQVDVRDSSFSAAPSNNIAEWNAKNTVLTTGAFYAKRENAKISVGIIQGTDTSLAVSNNFSTQDLFVEFSISAYKKNAHSSAGVTFTDFKIINGGSKVKSDPFDCKTLYAK